MPKQSDSVSHDKPCTICGTTRQVLVRCQIDETQRWHFVCPGKCWKDVSGGVEDAKGLESQYPFYRYGGMWKNKHADGPVSAKKPRKVKDREKKEASERAREGPDSTSKAENDDSSTETSHDEGAEMKLEDARTKPLREDQDVETQRDAPT